MPFRAGVVPIGYVRQESPSANLSAATQLFSRIGDRIKGRAESKAIAEVMGQGIDTKNIVGSAENMTQQLTARGIDATKALGLTNQAMAPYIAERAYTDSRADAAALAAHRAATLAETRRYHNLQSNKAVTPDIRTIEDVNPYTNEKTFYYYNSNSTNPEFNKVDMLGPVSMVDTEASTPTQIATSTVEPAMIAANSTTNGDVGNYTADYMAMAEANPIELGVPGAMTAGLGNVGGPSTIGQSNVQPVGTNVPSNVPSNIQPAGTGVTFSKPDRYGVSRGSNGTFRDQNGNYVIPVKLREVKEIKLADGSTSYVIINKATGRDASGNPVGDAKPQQPLSATIQLPTGQNVYVDNTGKPIMDEQGQYLVKSMNEHIVKKSESLKNIKNTMRELDDIINRVKTNPDSVGSIGSGLGNWIGNQIQDIIKAPTTDRLNRNQIEAKGGVIAAGLRKGVESGVMTDKDFERYMKLVPSVDDSPQEAIYKGNQLMHSLYQQYGVLPKGMKRQYNPKTGEYRIVREK